MSNKDSDILNYHVALVQRRNKAYENNDMEAYERLNRELAENRKRAAKLSKEPPNPKPDSYHEWLEQSLLSQIRALQTERNRLRDMLTGKAQIDVAYIMNLEDTPNS